MEEIKQRSRSKAITFNINVIQSQNNEITNTFLKDKASKTISNKANKSQPKESKFAPHSEKSPTQRKLTNSKSTKEIKNIEKTLLLSLEKAEKLDNEKIKMADEINFRDNPDKIMDTDEFGFIKESTDDKKQDKESLLQYNARLEKWNYMLNNFEEFSTKNSVKLKKRVRKGIPDCLRGYAWQKILNLDEFYKKDEYQNLNKEDCDKALEDVIVKDIDRTFPKNSFFNQKYGSGQRQLYKVLVNYSKYNKEVGYVQGMGFITALLLTYMDEERSFFMLHALMKKRELESLYLPGFPDLKKKLFVLLNLEKKYIPKIYNTFRRIEVVPFSYASEWLLCLFSRSLKFNSLVRIFDTFILEGYKVIYRFSLAFLKSKEHKIIESKDMDVLFKMIKLCFENVNIEEIFKLAYGFHISKKEIDNYEKEYEKNKDNKDNEFINQL